VKVAEKVIELHWNITRPTNPFEIDLDGVWQRAKSAVIANCETHVLSPEDLLLHLSMHGAYQHKLAFRLRSIYDIKKVVDVFRDEINWDSASERADQWKCTKPFLVSLQVVEDFFNVKLIDKIEEYDFENKNDLALQAETFLLDYPEPMHETIVEFAEKRSILDKLAYLLKRIFLSREEISINYGIPVTSFRRFIYYPVRAFELARKYKDTIWRITRADQEELVLVKENQDLLKIQKMLEPD